jgi:Fe-S oxidoreductase
MREIADEAIKIITQLGGVPSGEHGDGLARSEWLQLVFGSEIYNAFQELKRAADPKNILNPGKIIDSPRMDENLRYKIGESPPPWQTALDFSKQGGLVSAVELCNGAGVCRKQDGLMCPSFQATNEELHSTRGRANLMRALFTGDFSLADRFDRGAVFEALELCIACKGCKAECPSAVDMAKLKYEYLDWYYRENGNRHPVRDYLFAHVGDISRYGAKFKTGSNYILANINNYALGGRWLGLSKKRELPLLNDKSLRTMYKESATNRSTKAPYLEKVLFLSDPFTEYYQPEIGLAAIKTLHAADCEVEIIPTVGSGRTLISKGFLAPARKHAEKVIHEIGELDPGEEAFIVGIEPSEIFTLRDEYLDLLPTNPKAKSIAERAMMIDEFLVRPRNEGDLRILRIANNNNHSESHLKHVLLHGHCYQKTQPPAKDGYSSGVLATAQMLRSVGYSVEIIETGCCGMAGAFGYEVEHFDLSMEIGELSLFPKVRSAGEEAIITTSGFSCLTHIKDGTGREPVHPMELLPDQ